MTTPTKTPSIRIESPTWADYELLDSGNFEKMERFGAYILIRPEPQALWKPQHDEAYWKSTAHAHFVREQTDHFRFQTESKGGWKFLKKMPENWQVSYEGLLFRLALTQFGHVGIFPEQQCNWQFISSFLENKPTVSILNLFAYTGAASVVAAKQGAQVTHVDASRPSLNWANQNRQLNSAPDIRWVYEDAFKFVKREVKRRHRYHGIILDPPPYGRGPDGEKWVLEEKIDDLLAMLAELLEPSNSFLILSLYAAGLSSMVGKNMVSYHIPKAEITAGEFVLPHPLAPLPMGSFVRALV